MSEEKARVIENLPSENYHALQRFSSSGAKKILVSAQDFWAQSWMNKDRYEKKSDAFNLGNAYEKRIIEGKKAFNDSYAIPPQCDRRTKIGKDIYQNWVAQHGDKTEIDQRTIDEIERAAVNIEKTTDVFKGGKAQVTILWDDKKTGVPMKARLDYLKPFVIEDLKTFSNSNEWPPHKLVANHIVRYKYHIQAAAYREAVAMAKLCDDAKFNFVFQQTGQANNLIIKPFPANILLAQQGQTLLRFAIDKFADMYKKFGTTPWYDDWLAVPMTDDDFPLYAYDDD